MKTFHMQQSLWLRSPYYLVIVYVREAIIYSWSSLYLNWFMMINLHFSVLVYKMKSEAFYILKWP